MDIKAQYARLLQIRESDLMGGNLYAARVIRALLELKIAITETIEEGMKPEFVIPLEKRIDQCCADYNAAKVALDPGFAGADQKFAALKAGVNDVLAFAAEMRSDFDKLVVGEEYKGKIQDFFEFKSKYSSVTVPPLTDLFFNTGNEPFSFLSTENAIRSLYRELRDALRVAMSQGFSLTEELCKDTVTQYGKIEIIPTFSLAQGSQDSPLLFVCTPIREEFDIMLNANLGQNGIDSILQLDLAYLPKKAVLSSRDRVARFMMYAVRQRKPKGIAIYGWELLSEKEQKDLFGGISDYLKFASAPLRIVLLDKSGDMRGITAYASWQKDLSLLSAENRYLRLPSFGDVAEVVKGDEKKLEAVRTQCVFMGYRGLDLFFAKKGEEGLAFESAKYISDCNAKAVLAFLEDLPDDGKLLPEDWGYDPQIERKTTDTGSDEYDYDKIRDISDDKIRAIIGNGALSIFDKCGELVRYILLADEDRSVWTGVLDDEERAKRVIKATRIIAYTMRVFYSDPIVTVVTTRSGSWGGLCCNGGAEIKYKRDCVEDIDWTMDAILHELYHSLQHTVTDYATDLTWYKKTYHIENERIASWYSNDRSYVDIDDNRDIYEVQTMEVDARSFAGRCLGDQIYHKHRYNWKRV